MGPRVRPTDGRPPGTGCGPHSRRRPAGTARSTRPRGRSSDTRRRSGESTHGVAQAPLPGSGNSTFITASSERRYWDPVSVPLTACPRSCGPHTGFRVSGAGRWSRPAHPRRGEQPRRPGRAVWVTPQSLCQPPPQPSCGCRSSRSVCPSHPGGTDP